ncbi:cell-cell cohesion protein MtsF [Vitiosangium sp. GDMCC 1.1324]|uniref:cell-cell cohesion protein MtsF n=1 Tax=Vitiosangium sp. (strain GDMCC 1.1324) TaxID=2138576 RepID=UPI000D3CDEE2|nr:cell-cell cohesion protein MtsF [Vitiosangium sp. GDMCC 1.1324]PTL81937.1 cell-cell cohesion protein MtsF [Vitiosangium sp. GDMCC 1.1324]
MSTSVRLLSLVLLVLTACPSQPDGPPDSGEQEVPDLCNTREEALSSPECQLTLGQPLEDRYLSFGGDTDWYSVQLPSTVGPRSLLRVTAVYATPITAVNLSVSLLRQDGSALAPRRVDVHGQGQPKPVEFLIPISEAEKNAKVLLLLGDEPANPSRPGFDARNPYSLTVEVLDNPDTNEPNDTAAAATPVALTDQGGILVGSASGYLATAGDVDRFSFDVPAGRIVYVHVTAPSLSPQPPPAYILAYKLLRPDGTAEVDSRVRTNVLAVDLATARRVKAAGKWQVLVQAWNSGTSSEPVPGDTRLKYTVDVKVLSEGDPNDTGTDNDDMSHAKVATLSSGTRTTSFTGRLGSVPDKDWYAVDVPTDSTHTVLHYRLVSLSSGGRFPPLPETPDRLVRVLTEVPGFSAADCVGKVDVCPKGNGYGSDAFVTPLVNGWCNNSAPLCLRSSRDESEYFSNLRNFEGVIPVPPHGATVRYYFLVQDEGTSWADDKDYRLDVEWRDDTDETSRKGSGTTETPSTKLLASDDSAATFPAPPAGGAYEVSGSISYGLGRLVGNDPTKGQGVRGPEDYDAVPTDLDTFVFQLPEALPSPMDRTWELQWEVDNLPDGGTPYGLSLDLTFCDGDRAGDGGTSCTPVSTGTAGAPLTLAYRGDPLRAWHSPSGSLSNLQPLYKLERGSTSTKVTVQPYACSCFEPRFLRGGSLMVAVGGVDRTDYGQADYTLRTAYTSYPKSYTRLDGGTASCPAPDGGVTADGGAAPGCYFTRQP